VKFADIDLHPALRKGIEQLGYTECTDIQTQAIPHILAGRDVAGLAQTGTGKTAAFLLPLMDQVLRAKQKDEDAEPKAEIENVTEESDEASPRRVLSHWLPKNFILVLVPTRELADQVFTNIKELCPDGEISGVAVFGGTSYEKQIPQIKAGVDFIVATPGRLIDLYKEHVIDLKQVKAIVFDEADRMFDMGFKDDMKYILKRIDRERQFLVFSATLNFDVLNTAYEFGADPVEVNIGKDVATADNVQDEIFHVGHNEKPGQLLALLKQTKPKQVIIFSNFKRNVEKIALFLNRNGYPALGISSLLSQGQRNRVMAQFKSADEQNILVATDVAARGLDVEGVDLVVNFELPDDPENYVHRIGRTGRANAKGLAYSLVSDRDVEALARIEEYTKKKLEMGWVEDENLVSDYKPFPSDHDKELSRGAKPGGGASSRGKKGGGRPQRGKGGPRASRDRDDKDFKAKRKRKPTNKKRTQKGEERGDEASASAHRDRKTGRHPGSKPGESAQAKSKGPKRSPRGAGKKYQKKSGASRRSGGKTRSGGKAGARPAASAAPQSLGQKVGSFFKKVFGNG